MDNKDILEQTKRAWSLLIEKGMLRWPDEDVVRFLAKNYKYKKDRQGIKILDLGFGAGRHIRLLAKEGFDAYGVDFTENSVTLAQDILAAEGLNATLKIGELSNLPFADSFFDSVIGWGTLFYKPRVQIKEDLVEVNRVLKSGEFLCADFRSPDNWFYGLGEEIAPETFLVDERGGQYQGTIYHFITKNDLIELMNSAGFILENLEYKEQQHDNLSQKHAWWIVWARKS